MRLKKSRCTYKSHGVPKIHRSPFPDSSAVW